MISKDEQKTLTGVSESIARAVRTVIKREVQERRIDSMIGDNERRIAELEEKLGLSDPARKGGARRS